MKERLFTILFVILGVVLFQIFKYDFFPEGGTPRSVAAGAVGAVCAVIGGLIDGKRKKASS